MPTFTKEARLREYCIQHDVMLSATDMNDLGRYDLEWNMTQASSEDGERKGLGELYECVPDPSKYKERDAGALDGVIGRPSDIWITDVLYKDITKKLAKENSWVRRLSSWPIDRATWSGPGRCTNGRCSSTAARATSGAPRWPSTTSAAWP